MLEVLELDGRFVHCSQLMAHHDKRYFAVQEAIAAAALDSVLACR